VCCTPHVLWPSRSKLSGQVPAMLHVTGGICVARCVPCEAPARARCPWHITRGTRRCRFNQSAAYYDTIRARLISALSGKCSPYPDSRKSLLEMLVVSKFAPIQLMAARASGRVGDFRPDGSRMESGSIEIRENRKPFIISNITG